MEVLYVIALLNVNVPATELNMAFSLEFQPASWRKVGYIPFWRGL